MVAATLVTIAHPVKPKKAVVDYLILSKRYKVVFESLVLRSLRPSFV
jgi:hypothetical protein